MATARFSRSSWNIDPEEEAVNSELRPALEDRLGLLSSDLRTAMVLRDIQELSTKETSEALISVSSLKSRLHRARVLLRKHIEEYSSLTLLPPTDIELKPHA